MEQLADMINNEIMPRLAAILLRGDATAGQVQGRAKGLHLLPPYATIKYLLLLPLHASPTQNRRILNPNLPLQPAPRLLLLRPNPRPPSHTHRRPSCFAAFQQAPRAPLPSPRALAMADRLRAWEALKLHKEGKLAEALNYATELVRTNPDSAPVLNVAATLHVHASNTAWNEGDPGGDESASAWVSRHRRAAIDAFSAAARVAPNCALIAALHAEALVADNRFADAMVELSRVLEMTTNHDDPALHHVVYDVKPGPNAKWRKSDAVNKASTLMEQLADMINNEIMPRLAAILLRGDATAGQVQGRAKGLSQTYPYSSRAQLLRVYIELEQARAVEPLVRRKGLLRRILDLISHASGYFDSSLLIALFHAKLLFALDDLGESERECRRALRIEEPTDPNLDDIPPAVSVPGADCDARVSSLKRQLRILLKHIIVVAGLCWSSIQTTQHRDRVDNVISVRVDRLQEYYDGIDQSAAKTISGAVRFLKNQGSWSFLICPNSSCDGKKFVDTESLWEHIRSKHRYELWNKLQSILDQHDIFNLPRVQDMFESLLLSPSIGIQQAEPLVEMRRRKCREGAEILEDIKKKLRMLPKNILSTEYEEFCFAIKNLWFKFLETSALDHREVILPLARSFQWIELKRSIALSAKDLGGIIGGINIDAVLGKAPAVPDHQSGDNLQSKKLKPSCADETLKADEKCEESGARVVNNNSGTMLDQSSSDPPTDVDESVRNIAARFAEVELDKKGTSGQSFKEMASTSSQQSINVFNKNNADKDLSNLSLIIRSLCNLRHFRDKLLMDPLVWIPSVDNPCIAQKFYEILFSWEENDHHLTDAVLTYMKTLLCKIVDCTTFYEKLQVGTNFASDIVATILIGLHMSESCSRFSLNKEIDKHALHEWSTVVNGAVTRFTLTLAYCKICCVDESYVCFARGDEDKWLIYGFETVETEDTWEHLLERFKDCKL
ncbi:unnamed protein product [Alopecurus aequalis]